MEMIDFPVGGIIQHKQREENMIWATFT